MTTNDWKQKYLNKLDQLETSEKEWAKFEEFFRQTLSRLALAAEGASSLLDSKLLALRKAIRKGEGQTKLAIIMEEISTELVRLDKLKAVQKQGNSGFLTKVVDSLSISPEMEKKAKRLRKHLNAKKSPEDEVLVSEFGEFFKHCLVIAKQMGEESARNNGGDKKGSFFGRILASLGSDDDNEAAGKERKSLEPAAEATQSEPLKEIESTATPLVDDEEIQDDPLGFLAPDNRQAFEQSVTESLHNILDGFIESLDYPEEHKSLLREKLFSIKPTKEIHVLLGDLAQMLRKTGASVESDDMVQAEAHEILIRLLEFIPLEEKFQEQAEKLKQDFAKGISQKDLPSALEAIAHLISEMQKENQKDQKQFETFLVTVTGRLNEVDEFLNADLKEHKLSWENGVKLDNAVKEHVKGIGESVSEATDLKDLESNVQTRLETLLAHVEEHRKDEIKRVKRIQQQNQQLKDQVKSLEQETGELKDSIVASQEKAYVDALTKLPNRMAYDQKVDEEFERWKRYHENLLLMVWDIDFFKSVNDTYGHKAGDKVLRIVAKLLRDKLRKTDFIARYGGEEFVSLLPETSLGGGFKIAEKMREAVQELDFHYRDQKVQLTISCGISLFADGDDPEKVFERADAALYQAKKQGRNRCVIAQDK